MIRTLPVARVLFSCARPMRISFALRNASSRCTADLAGVTARLPGAICPSYERGVPQAASHESFVNLSVSSSQKTWRPSATRLGFRDRAGASLALVVADEPKDDAKPEKPRSLERTLARRERANIRSNAARNQNLERDSSKALKRRFLETVIQVARRWPGATRPGSERSSQAEVCAPVFAPSSVDLVWGVWGAKTPVRSAQRADFRRNRINAPHTPRSRLIFRLGNTRGPSGRNYLRDFVTL